MGSPISPSVANLLMEEFESKSISTAPNPSRLWLGCVDDTFMIQQAIYSQHFLQHIISIDLHIQITTEAAGSNGSIPFLDTPVSLGPNNTLTSVYRKLTHTDQYLHWDRHHNLSAKYSIFNTLTHRTGLFVPTHNYFGKRRNTLEKLFLGASTPHGP